MMRWRTLIDNAYAAARHGAQARYQDPASEELLLEVEGALACPLPDEVADLLRETNGVMELLDVDGLLTETWWLIWPAAKLRDESIATRREQGDNGFPRGAIAFSGAGTDGIVFGVDVLRNLPGVFAWYPLERESISLAPTVREFVTGWIGGDISV
jgi:SMI1/KNR4 family protein SUKH-1